MGGFISYPRTESSRYDPSFDLEEALLGLGNNPAWGHLVSKILNRGPITAPKTGVDAGDHPPITPMRGAARASIRGEADWRLYELVTRAFLGSLMPPCVYAEATASLSVGGEAFTYTWHTLKEGLHFGEAMPWRLNTLRCASSVSPGRCFATMTILCLATMPSRIPTETLFATMMMLCYHATCSAPTSRGCSHRTP